MLNDNEKDKIIQFAYNELEYRSNCRYVSPQAENDCLTWLCNHLDAIFEKDNPKGYIVSCFYRIIYKGNNKEKKLNKEIELYAERSLDDLDWLMELVYDDIMSDIELSSLERKIIHDIVYGDVSYRTVFKKYGYTVTKVNQLKSKLLGVFLKHGGDN